MMLLKRLHWYKKTEELILLNVQATSSKHVRISLVL